MGLALGGELVFAQDIDAGNLVPVLTGYTPRLYPPDAVAMLYIDDGHSGHWSLASTVRTLDGCNCLRLYPVIVAVKFHGGLMSRPDIGERTAIDQIPYSTAGKSPFNYRQRPLLVRVGNPMTNVRDAVTVVIPHLNEPDNLNRCVLSIAEQRSSNIPFEIVIVDNGSATVPNAGRWPNLDVRVAHESTPGPGHARNRGVQLARSDAIAFIDADCVACDGWMAGIARRLLYGRNHDVLGGAIRVRQEKRGQPSAIEAYENIYSYRARLFVERDHYAATGNMAVRREVFEAVGPFGGIGISEDREWGQRAFELGYRIDFAPDVVVETQASKNVRELMTRIDRQVAHDYNETVTSSRARLGWIARSAAIGLSPLFELALLMRATRVPGFTLLVSVWLLLLLLRWYRSARMTELALGGSPNDMVKNWNK